MNRLNDLTPMLTYRIDSETDIERLLQFLVESFPFFGRHDLELAVVALELNVLLLTLTLNPAIRFL